MELIRDYRQYPWMRILAGACIAFPVGTAMYFYPDWHSARASGFIAIWLDATLRTSALALSFYRFVVTSRGPWSVENGFQMFALYAPTFLRTSTVRADPDASPSVWALLLTDRGSVFLSLFTIAVSIGFIVFARYRRSKPLR